jgi:RNA polymerase sigma factor (sigma-70 family)
VGPRGNAFDPAADRELLRRFAARRDEAAFAEIVRRHGPMLVRLGQRILHSGHDAEDVCQAAFLLLAQQAASLRAHASIAGWLFQTVYRLALKARTAAGRRSRREARAKPVAPSDPVAEVTVGELQAVLDAELSRLPEKWRAPILLCCLEGHSRDEAARCLGWSLAEVKNGLQHGRERLRSRLARRGLALGTALMSTWLLGSRDAGATGLSPDLARAALAIATGRATLKDYLPPHVVALTRGAMTMFARTVTILLLAGVALGLGAAGVVTGLPGAVPPTQPATTAPPPVQPALPQPAQQPAVPQPLSIALGGHREAVHALALDAAGTTLASAGADKTVRVWDLATGRQLQRLDSLGEAISVAFSPNGKRLAAALGGKDSTLLVWDAETGKLLWRGVSGMKGTGTGAGAAVVFSPDGEFVAAQFAGAVTLYEGASGKLLFALRLPSGPVREAITFTPDGRTLAVADADGAVYLAEGATGGLTAKFRGQRPVRALAFVAGGARLAAADGGKAIRLFDVATGKEQPGYESPEAVEFLTVTADGKWAATAAEGGTVLVWDLAAGKSERRIKVQGPLHALALGPAGRLLVTAGTDGAVVWDLTRDEKPLPKNYQLTANEMDALWADLASDEAGKAYAAARLLRADPARSVPFLKGQLKSKIDPPTAAKLKELIAELDATEFKKRETATKELEQFGLLAEPALQAALATNPPLETTNRLKRLLKLLEGDKKLLTAEQQRDVRAVRVLEGTGASEARQVLQALLKESPGWWIRQEAQAALKRLDVK